MKALKKEIMKEMELRLSFSIVVYLSKRERAKQNAKQSSGAECVSANSQAL